MTTKAPFRRAVLPLALLALAAGCGDDSDPKDPPEEPQLDPAAGGVRKLTARQYIESVRVLLGDAAAAAASPPDDASALGLKVIAAADYPIASADVETYELSARRVAAAAVADDATRARIATCEPSGPTDAACFSQIATRFGRLAWRRTLEQEEVDTLATAASTGADAYESVDAGIEALVSAAIQAPDFLYQIEIGEPDPEDATRRRLLPTELASRMSFFILGRAPDEALLDLAEAEELADEASIRQAAADLVALPEARAALNSFYAEVYDFEDVASIQKDPAKFPLFTDATREAIGEGTRLFLEDIVWTRNADAREIFSAPVGYVNQDNAWLYGLSVTGTEFQRVEIANRAGILTQPSFLAKHAQPGTTSPTRRGLFVITNVLCGGVAPPPPGVTPTLPPDDGTPKTMRQKLEQHASDESCAECHGRMDPLGLALEHFDSVGAFRQKDQGLTIDATGSTEEVGEFDGAVEMGNLLSESEVAATCMVKYLYRQSMGHVETPGEADALAAVDKAFVESDYRVQDLMTEIAASPAFRLVGEPK
jgi:hypothetical protein